MDAQELVEKIDIPKTAGELRQIARETFGKYYGDKVQSELVHNFAKYGLVLHKGENNNVQKYGGELSKVRRRVGKTWSESCSNVDISFPRPSAGDLPTP